MRAEICDSDGHERRSKAACDLASAHRSVAFARDVADDLDAGSIKRPDDGNHSNESEAVGQQSRSRIAEHSIERYFEFGSDSQPDGAFLETIEGNAADHDRDEHHQPARWLVRGESGQWPAQADASVATLEWRHL